MSGVRRGFISKTCQDFWYSFDMLLPIIRLREKHYQIEITHDCTRRYFYIHKILGYVLGLFMIAGLTGLTH